MGGQTDRCQAGAIGAPRADMPRQGPKHAASPQAELSLPHRVVAPRRVGIRAGAGLSVAADPPHHHQPGRLSR
jgi:hypothetical protein